MSIKILNTIGRHYDEEAKEILVAIGEVDHSDLGQTKFIIKK